LRKYRPAPFEKRISTKTPEIFKTTSQDIVQELSAPSHIYQLPLFIRGLQEPNRIQAGSSCGEANLWEPNEVESSSSPQWCVISNTELIQTAINLFTKVKGPEQMLRAFRFAYVQCSYSAAASACLVVATVHSGAPTLKRAKRRTVMFSPSLATFCAISSLMLTDWSLMKGCSSRQTSS